MNEAGFQTAGHSDLNNTEITKCWLTATACLFWWPQLLKLDMVCRIPSDTLTLPDTKMKNIYKYHGIDGIHTDLPTLRYFI